MSFVCGDVGGGAWWSTRSAQLVPTLGGGSPTPRGDCKTLGDGRCSLTVVGETGTRRLGCG